MKQVYEQISQLAATPAHNIGYNFGEDVLVKSVKLFCGVAYDILANKVL